MANLKVKIGKLELDNPIMLGSATPTWDGKRSDRGFMKGAAAVIPKTICLGEDHYRHPENGRFRVLKKGNQPYGMVNVEIFTTMPESAWVTRELKIAKQNGAKIIASTLAMEDPKDTMQLIRNIESTGLVDAFELNNSCPMHVSMTDINIIPMTKEQASAARKATKLPLTIKFPSTLSSLCGAAKAAEDCGVDGVVISNSMRGFAGVDIQNGNPWFGTTGGYSGTAIKPLIQCMVIDVAKAINIPIIAVGGISTWEDIVEYIMLGASAVQVVSSVMWQGYHAIEKMKSGLEGFMGAKGYKDLDDFRGIALPKIGSYESILDALPLRAVIDQDTCIRCGKCVNTCFYDAISKGENVYVVDPQLCDGCGLCEQLCPVGAVHLAAK